MTDHQKAVAFNVDGDSLRSLQDALPEWDIELVSGATTDSLSRDWNPDMTDLAIISAQGPMTEALGLCRGLRSQAGRAHTPLLVLVPPNQDTLIRAALEAGADNCLVLPIHAKQVVSVLARAGTGNRPGHHTLNLDQAQRDDRWRDEGGQG